MEEYLNASQFTSTKGSVITIGTFDGVHLGHKEIIKRLTQAAAIENLSSVVLTFFPHPRMVLQKNSDIKLINTIGEKKQLLDNAGVDHFVVEPFTYEFSRMTAEEYVRDLLVGKLKAKKIIIGYDHRFGRNRNADINDLIAFGKEYNFTVEQISAQELDHVAISSTKIRNALLDGDIATANQYLGYNFNITGTVVTGKALGRTINYPTANLQIKQSFKLVPKNGVYVTSATINGTLQYGITSIGTNPTVGGTEKTIETYFLDFDGNLYNTELTIIFLSHIRNEETFSTIEILKQAIQQDEIAARKFIENIE
ncbi:riboflavin biosynthesis protein [Patiriisocius marinus]|uniref:Riboflavin biosynthesis protein n=1 Tax=Patiriisocius marinus TaxID=1397112 RepID=A0A5J4IXU9_9FLAO|nr:bifunctional riboflavin kinase/FAD synthetase [Patiriisocius marinus]GER58428.1 riboflavin biosynthesis protein [Patiriisocius marinus]